MSILIVDDMADTAESEADLLALLGHETRIARSGEEALRCVAEAQPDVVLLDILLPGIDGFAVARAIRERCAGAGKQPLIVAVTGYGEERDRRRSSDAGMDLHLVKPVPPPLLAGVLERFRRLLAPPIPAAELDPPPDGSSFRTRSCGLLWV